jgi:hypothetical protein
LFWRDNISGADRVINDNQNCMSLEAPQRGVADLIICRQKDGPTGTVELTYTVETGNFSDYMVHFADLYVASGEGCEVTSKGNDDVDKAGEEEFPLEEG